MVVIFKFLIFLYFILKSKSNDIDYYSSKEKFKNSNKSNFFHYIKFKNYSISSKKNLLIGAVIKYKWYKIEPFFQSFKKSNFTNCEVVMFVNKMSENTINKIKSFGVIVHKIPNKFNNIRIINYRWKIYEDYLQDNIDKYDLVFTADLRDTFFQLDIFKFYNSSHPFLGVAIEDGTLSERKNKKWIINAYGEDLHKTIKNERIICVGTIWGTPDKFLEFSRIMWKKLSSKWSVNLKVIEQGVANFLIYHDKLFKNCLIRSENKDGKVMTIGLSKKENINIDSENNILNGKGEIAAVIHQYDRKRYIVQKVRKKFCSQIININKKDVNKVFIGIKKKVKDNLNKKRESNKIKEILSIFITIIIFLIYIFILGYLILYEFGENVNSQKSSFFKKELNNNKLIKFQNFEF